MWAAETNVDRRRILAAAGHKVAQALQLAETDPHSAHVLVNVALAEARDTLKYHDLLVPILSAAIGARTLGRVSFDRPSDRGMHARHQTC
jgi:hypothetical protein